MTYSRSPASQRQLEEAILRVGEIVGQSRVIIVGSQAILATWGEDLLPPEATMPAEADIAGNMTLPTISRTN